LGPDTEPEYFPKDREAQSLEHEGEKDADGESAIKIMEEEAGDSAGHCIAVLMMISIVFGSIIFMMSQTTAPHVANVTKLTLDLVMCIFMAVLWFQAIDDILTATVPGEHHVAISLIIAFGAITIAMFMAWSLKKRSASLAALCGAGAHFCAFMGAGLAVKVQKNHWIDSPMWCAVGFLVVCALFAGILTVLYFIKKSCFGIRIGRDDRAGVDEFMDRFDDLEGDFTALALASYWVLVLRYWIVGEYPEDADVKPGDAPPHSSTNRMHLFILTIVLLVIGTVVCQMMTRLKDKNYAMGRVSDIFKSFMVFNFVFSFLTWSEMYFYEHKTMNVTPIMTRILFACGCTGMCALAILLLAQGTSGAGARAMLLKSIGLIAGCAWEETFDAAMEVLFEPYEHAHWIKGLTALLLSVVILPAYVNYWRPIAAKAEEEEGG
jgi:hypothetical protein